LYRYTAFGEEYATDADTPPASVTQPLQCAAAKRYARR